MPTHWVLSLAEYLDQFCVSVPCAVVSSARQASLLRPSMTEPRPAASQLGSTLSLGGLSARTGADCDATPRTPRVTATHAVLITRAHMVTRANMANLVAVRLSGRSGGRGEYTA